MQKSQFLKVSLLPVSQVPAGCFFRAHLFGGWYIKSRYFVNTHLYCGNNLANLTKFEPDQLVWYTLQTPLPHLSPF